MKYEKGDVQSDTEGSTSSTLNVKLVRSYEDAQRDLNFSYSYQASAKVNLAKIVSGESSLTAAGSYANFFRQQSDTMLLVIEASANHGRDYIPNYPLDQKYQTLLDQKQYEQFEKECGTHFIRAVTRVSTLRVIFTFSNLTKNSKNVITQKLGSSGGVNVGVGSLSAGGKAELSANLSIAIGTGSKLGNVTYDVTATGGAGVATVGKLLSGANLSSTEDISKVIEGIIGATGDFSRKNSAPDKYILIPYPQTSGIAPPFNQQQYDKLGEIFRALIRVDAQREIYAKYQKENADLWQKYFRVYALKLDDVRKVVVSAYVTCRRDGKCDQSLPDVVDGVLSSGHIVHWAIVHYVSILIHRC